MTVKHIVMWRIEGEDKFSRAEKIKGYLESLRGKIPGLIKIEAGIDFSAEADSSELVLYSEFKDREALKQYATHPEHLAILPKIKELRGSGERRVVDYEG
jgi:quinol monooxygenase YgiN